MEIKELLEHKETLHRQFTVNVSKQELDDAKKEKLEEVAKTVKLDGFRKGKAPLDIVKRNYDNTITQEAINSLLQSSIQQIYKENEIKAFNDPEVNVDKFDDEGLNLSVLIDLYPEFDTKDIKDLEIEEKDLQVSEKDIKEAMDRLSSYFKEFKDVEEERPAENGDTTVIDFLGKVDGVAFEGGKGEDYPLELGSNSFIPGFEDQIVGKKVNEKFDVNVEFPKEYHAENLAGKPAVFEVTIKKLQQAVNHEINDELAEKCGYKNLEDLKADVEKSQKVQYTDYIFGETKRNVFEALKAHYTFELPSRVAKKEYEAVKAYYDNEKKQAEENENAPKGRFSHLYKKDDKEVEKELKEIAEANIKLVLVIGKISAENSIAVLPADIENFIQQESMKYPGREQEISKYYKENKEAERALRSTIIENKVVDNILSTAKVKKVEVSVEELLKPSEDEE